MRGFENYNDRTKDFQMVKFYQEIINELQVSVDLMREELVRRSTETHSLPEKYFKSVIFLFEFDIIIRAIYENLEKLNKEIHALRVSTDHIRHNEEGLKKTNGRIDYLKYEMTYYPDRKNDYEEAIKRYEELREDLLEIKNKEIEKHDETKNEIKYLLNKLSVNFGLSFKKEFR